MTRISFEKPHESLSFTADKGVDYFDLLDEIAEHVGGERAEAVWFPEDGIGRILVDAHKVVATFWID